MGKEDRYVEYLYNKYEGRIAIGVGYKADLSEIFPFVFVNSTHTPIGIVALAVLSRDDDKTAHIYHISSFTQQLGNGCKMLGELCRQADNFQINLSLSPIAMPNGKDETISDECLKNWYKKFGFQGHPLLVRTCLKTDNQF